MLSRLAFFLDRLNIQNACAAYFFLAPVFLSREDDAFNALAYAAGYLVSGIVVFLALSERLSVFAETTRFRNLSLLFVLMVGMCFWSVLINTPGLLLHPSNYFFKYAKLIFPVISFFVMINIWKLGDLSKLYTLIFAFGIVSVVFAILEILLAGGFSRVGMLLFDDPNKYAMFLNILYGMTLPRLLNDFLRGRPVTGLFMVALALCGALFLTASRSGYLTFLVITVICLWASRSAAVRRRAVIILIPVILLFVIAVLSRYQGSVHGAAQSDMGRLWTYLVGIAIVKQHPLTGIGYANVLSAYDQFGPLSEFLLGRAVSIHNATLEIFAETGLFGAVTYLLMVFIPTGILWKRISLKSRDRLPVAELAALNIPVAFFVYGMFYPNYLADDYFWIYMSFTIIVIRAEVPRDFELRWVGPKLV